MSISAAWGEPDLTKSSNIKQSSVAPVLSNCPFSPVFPPACPPRGLLTSTPGPYDGVARQYNAILDYRRRSLPFSTSWISFRLSMLSVFCNGFFSFSPALSTHPPLPSSPFSPLPLPSSLIFSHFPLTSSLLLSPLSPRSLLSPPSSFSPLIFSPFSPSHLQSSPSSPSGLKQLSARSPWQRPHP